VPLHDPIQVRSAARAILRRAEFQPAKRSWWSAAWNWLLREVAKLLGRLLGLAGGSGAMPWLVVAVLAVVVGLMAVAAVRAWSRLPAGPSTRVVVTASTAGRSAIDWWAEAARHERDGRWRDALRCKYRALVADLAGRGVVEEVPGGTAGEYRSVVQASIPAVAADFSGATDLFEGAWYGNRPTAQADQTHFDELARRVLATAPASRR